MIRHKEIVIEQQETFPKQTHRNRTVIVTANGPMTLTVPVLRPNGNHTLTSDIGISYTEKWNLIHWRAIESAYSGTPYFLYFRDFIYPFFEKKYEFLFDYNLELTEVLLQLFKIKKVPAFTETFEKEYHERLDLRNLIHPKKEPLLQKTPYHQVFDDRFPFIGNLSVIDLLFNAGPDLVYLLNLHS